MGEVVIVTRLKAKPNCATALEKELQALATASTAETGCLLYAIHRNVNDAANFVLIQRWESQAALDKHFVTIHFLTHSMILATLLTAPPEITYLEPLGHGDKGRIS